MRIPGNLNKCVVYVGIDSAVGFVPLGTGTVVGVQYNESITFFFLLTAKHVVDQISKDSFSMRINRLTGQAQSLLVKRTDIITHTEENNDLALFPVSLGSGVYDVRAILLDRVDMEKQRTEFYDLDVGDEVVVVGLYTSHFGRTKNIPVTRLGNLAMLLDEPVRGPGGYVEAYLIELRTIAGLSGSPVFINPPPVTVQDGKLKYRRGSAYLPLGVLVGYHVVESKEDQVLVPRFLSPNVRGVSNDVGGSIDERNTVLMSSSQ